MHSLSSNKPTNLQTYKPRPVHTSSSSLAPIPLPDHPGKSRTTRAPAPLYIAQSIIPCTVVAESVRSTLTQTRLQLCRGGCWSFRRQASGLFALWLPSSFHLQPCRPHTGTAAVASRFDVANPNSAVHTSPRLEASTSYFAAWPLVRMAPGPQRKGVLTLPLTYLLSNLTHTYAYLRIPTHTYAHPPSAPAPLRSTFVL